MSKYPILSLILKAYLFFGGIMVLLIIIGSQEDEPIKREPWLPRVNYEKEAMKNRTKYKKTNTNYYREDPWCRDRREQTENWADFLETLENRGHTIYDPEAEDIWEEFY